MFRMGSFVTMAVVASKSRRTSPFGRTSGWNRSSRPPKKVRLRRWKQLSHESKVKIALLVAFVILVLAWFLLMWATLLTDGWPPGEDDTIRGLVPAAGGEQDPRLADSLSYASPS